MCSAKWNLWISSPEDADWVWKNAGILTDRFKHLNNSAATGTKNIPVVKDGTISPEQEAQH